jgi:hypothetical protein
MRSAGVVDDAKVDAELAAHPDGVASRALYGRLVRWKNAADEALDRRRLRGVEAEQGS